MNLLWPSFLLLLGFVPLLVAGYLWLLRRRRKFAVRYSSLSLVRAALSKQSHLRRHLPFALFLFAFISLVVALSRPVAKVNVPINQSTVILTIDSSRSMRQTDIFPSRLEAAQQAALAFVTAQQSKVQIGVVAFARFAELIHPPTNDEESLKVAIRSLSTGRGTAIGSGIIEAIEAIADIDSSVAPLIPNTGSDDQSSKVPEGYFSPNIIVLLTDGVNYGGPPPLEAAQMAADRGIRVYAIGFGTETGDSNFSGPPGQGGGGDNQSFNGGFFRRGIDEATLREIAFQTGGEYFYATSAGELQSVFENLPTYFITREEMTEISFAFTAAGALLAAAASILALLWRPLP